MKSTHNHSFDPHLIAARGIACAAIIHHFQYWIEYNMNRPNGKTENFRDGRWWTYQTLENIAAHFIYLSKKQVEKAINKLVKDCVLVKGNYNKIAYDRTVWYAFKDEDLWVKKKTQPTEPHHIPKWGNRNPPQGTPIPDTKPYIIDINDSDEEETSDRYRSYLDSPEQTAFFDRVLDIIPKLGDPLMPREVSFWIKTYGIDKITVAIDTYFEQMELNKNRAWKQPRCMGAYVRGLLNERDKECASPAEENKQYALQCKELIRSRSKAAAKEISVRKDHVFFASLQKDFDYNLAPDTFRSYMSEAMRFILD